ncbi:MAG: 50S ribosomal protein L21 [Spirochaetaceae bacterium]|jgi:large subunit ribosomal protein L21|nr:50S ribosomal protein L21 [Spirochaetaceae bacterium]
MYALIEYKGKQYKAEKGAVLTVDKVNEAAGAKLNIETVLLVSNEGAASVGTPYVPGARVEAVVEKTFRDRKVLVLKYKSKKDYRRLIGHRQSYTNIRVEDIVVA